MHGCIGYLQLSSEDFSNKRFQKPRKVYRSMAKVIAESKEIALAKFLIGLLPIFLLAELRSALVGILLQIFRILHYVTSPFLCPCMHAVFALIHSVSSCLHHIR
jgi:hypothetical protein